MSLMRGWRTLQKKPTSPVPERFFKNVPPAVRTLRRCFQNVIRHARIGAGNPIEDVIERDLGILLIAGFTRFDQPLGFAQNRGINENDDLLFWGGIEEVAWHCGRILSPPYGHLSDIPTIRPSGCDE
jgi:hypothetical protein